MKRPVDRTNAARQRRYIERLKNRESLEIERLKQEQKGLRLQIEILERLIAKAKAANQSHEHEPLLQAIRQRPKA